MTIRTAVCFCLITMIMMNSNEAKEQRKNRNERFSGMWGGKMIQPAGPRGEEGYTQFLQLTVRGSIVRGKAQIEIPGSPYYGEMYVSGTIKGDTLYFREDSIVAQQAREGHWWCLKKGWLVLDAAAGQLNGPWSNSDCAPGRIELHRIFPK